MADANTHVRVHRLKELDVPEALINGNKFIKWDEVSYVVYSKDLYSSEAHNTSWLLMPGSCGWTWCTFKDFVIFEFAMP